MARVENLYLLTGNNDWEKEEVLQKLQASLFPKGISPLDQVTFEGKSKELNPEEVLSDLLTVPFISHKRFILVRDAEKLPASFQGRLLEAVTRLPKETICVLETKEADPRGNFLEKLAPLATVCAVKEVKPAELPLWIERRSAFYGKKISSGAAQLLLEKVGGNLWKLDKSLEAIATYAGEKHSIEEQTVETLMGVSVSRTSFELAHAVASREAAKALTIFSRLLSEKGNVQEIIGATGWQLRRMLRSKELLEEGKSRAEIGRMLRIRWDTQDDFFEMLSRFERPEIEKGLSQLLLLDRGVKTGVGDPKRETERFIVALCR